MKLFAEGGKTVDWCKNKCMQFSECGVIELMDNGWCYIWKNSQSCTEYTSVPGQQWSIYKSNVQFGNIYSNGCAEYLTSDECKNYADKTPGKTWRYGTGPTGCFEKVPDGYVWFQREDGKSTNQHRPVCKVGKRYY